LIGWGSVQKVAPAEVAKEMLRILQESETNDFDGIATGNESWFQYTTTSLKNVCSFGSRCHFEDAACSWCERIYDHAVLHRK
jgi:hypothetical protein